MITDELRTIIEMDIVACENQMGTERGSDNLYRALIAKYDTVYDGFSKEIPVTGKMTSVNREFDYRPEINAIKEKLKIILITGILKQGHGKASTVSIYNSNENIVTVNISFEEVKRKIEEMSSLSDSETKDALNKIDEIKAILELQEPKKTKWQKIKPILSWLADKSVDVGIAVLPLILKIGG